MAMDEVGLAQEVIIAMGYGSLSKPIIGWAKGIVEEVKASSSATFGLIPGPHPTSGTSGPAMAQKIANYAGYGATTKKLIQFCNGIAEHINNNALVTYSAPPPAPPVILPPMAWFIGGKVSGMDGSAMAALVAKNCEYGSVSPKLIALCGAIVKHIESNALVTSGKYS